MEFNEKLQELRKRKGLTQEELAQALYVSRTAISKWEAGRGYPNIDSLKAIAKFFGVTIDDLLCGDELLSLAEEDQKQKEIHLRDLVFGLLDCSAAIFFFLPFFAQKTENIIQEVSLFALHQVPAYLKAAFYIAVIGVVAWGVLTLALQNWKQPVWVRNKSKISLIISMLAALLFIVSLQPYAAVLMFLSLTIKVIMLIKWQ